MLLLTGDAGPYGVPIRYLVGKAFMPSAESAHGGRFVNRPYDDVNGSLVGDGAHDVPQSRLTAGGQWPPLRQALRAFLCIAGSTVRSGVIWMLTAL